MISKYNSMCRYCKKPTLANKDQYDQESKTSFHAACEEDLENQPPSREQFALAERLGYIEYRQDMGSDGLLLKMHKTTDGSSAGRIEPDTSGRNGVLWKE